jgi:hypothetical protein
VVSVNHGSELDGTASATKPKTPSHAALRHRNTDSTVSVERRLRWQLARINKIRRYTGFRVIQGTLAYSKQRERGAKSSLGCQEA